MRADSYSFSDCHCYFNTVCFALVIRFKEPIMEAIVSLGICESAPKDHLKESKRWIVCEWLSETGACQIFRSNRCGPVCRHTHGAHVVHSAWAPLKNTSCSTVTIFPPLVVEWLPTICTQSDLEWVFLMDWKHDLYCACVDSQLLRVCEIAANHPL